MDKKKISKQEIYYTIASMLMIAGCLLNIFSIQIADKIAIKQQQIANAGAFILSLGGILAVIEIRKK